MLWKYNFSHRKNIYIILLEISYVNDPKFHLLSFEFIYSIYISELIEILGKSFSFDSIAVTFYQMSRFSTREMLDSRTINHASEAKKPVLRVSPSLMVLLQLNPWTIHKKSYITSRNNNICSLQRKLSIS